MVERKRWVDVSKATGIALVVIGHVLAASGTTYQQIVFYIFLFHMPLFFMLSGVLHRSRGIVKNARRRFDGLLIPYVAFVLLIFVMDMVISHALGRRPSAWGVSGASRLLLGGSYATGKYGVLWFATCLFIVSFLFDFMSSKWKPQSGAMVGFVLVMLAASAAVAFRAPLPNPIGILDVPAAFVAYWFGRLIAEKTIGRRALIWFVVVTILVASSFAYVGWAMTFDIKNLRFGQPVIGLALALALSLILTATCAQFRQPWLIRWLTFISEETLTIMMLHQFVHFSLREIGVTNTGLLIAISFLVPLVFAAMLRASYPTRRVFLGRSA